MKAKTTKKGNADKKAIDPEKIQAIVDAKDELNQLLEEYNDPLDDLGWAWQRLLDAIEAAGVNLRKRSNEHVKEILREIPNNPPEGYQTVSDDLPQMVERYLSETK
jgi:hypothetical protein